jgi:hypothetical protein
MDSPTLAGFAALLNGFRTGRAEKVQQALEAKKAASEEALQGAQTAYYGRQAPMVSSAPLTAAYNQFGVDPNFPPQISFAEAQANEAPLKSFESERDRKERISKEENDSKRVASSITKERDEARKAIKDLLAKRQELAAQFMNDLTNPQYLSAAKAVDTQIEYLKQIESEAIKRGRMLGYKEFTPVEMPTNPFPTGEPTPVPTPAPTGGVNPSIMQGLQNRLKGIF